MHVEGLDPEQVEHHGLGEFVLFLPAPLLAAPVGVLHNQVHERGVQHPLVLGGLLGRLKVDDGVLVLQELLDRVPDPLLRALHRDGAVGKLPGFGGKSISNLLRMFIEYSRRIQGGFKEDSKKIRLIPGKVGLLVLDAVLPDHRRDGPELMVRPLDADLVDAVQDQLERLADDARAIALLLAIGILHLGLPLLPLGQGLLNWFGN